MLAKTGARNLFYRLLTKIGIGRQMPPGGTGIHRRIPDIQPAVFHAICSIVLITPAAIYLIIKVLPHPNLLAYFHRAVGFTVSAVGERARALRAGAPGKNSARRRARQPPVYQSVE
jgi:hypothetical protein